MNTQPGPIRRLLRMIFRKDNYRIFTFRRSRFDYHKEVGDGLASSTVAAPVLWVARTFPEAPATIWNDPDGNGQAEIVRRHPMLRLLRKPNGFYPGTILWMATTADWMVDGNAYWLKVRDQVGRVRELWWTPSWMVEPKGDEATFITRYEYKPSGLDVVPLAPDDVVHFRFGLDPDDPRKGYSPLKSVLREVFTDDEAAAFTASLLRNMGVPGLIISPETGVILQDGDIDETKAYVKEKFTGENRGEPMVMTGATKVEQFGFSPEQLLLRELRRIPEERVTAVTGIPAIVAGLGAGLDRSTFTNMSEAREAAYEAGIIPMQRILAEEINLQLLVEYEDEGDVLDEVWRFGFDLSRVRVLQEDLYRLAQRHDLAIRGGWETVAEGRRAMQLDVEGDRDNVFLRQLNVETVPADGPAPPRPVVPANGNGGGGAHAQEIAAEVVRALERRELLSG